MDIPLIDRRLLGSAVLHEKALILSRSRVKAPPPSYGSLVEPVSTVRFSSSVGYPALSNTISDIASVKEALIATQESVNAYPNDSVTDDILQVYVDIANTEKGVIEASGFYPSYDALQQAAIELAGYSQTIEDLMDEGLPTGVNLIQMILDVAIVKVSLIGAGGLLSDLEDAITISSTAPFAGDINLAMDEDLGMATLGGGDLVVAGVHDDPGPNDSLVLQRFNSAGTQVGTDVTLTTAGNNKLSGVDVTALSGGGYVVTYVNTTANELRARIYDAAGEIVGSEFVVGSGESSAPSVSSLTNGGFVIVRSDPSPGQGTYGQIFDATGTELSDFFLDSSGQKNVEKVAGLAGGGFVVSYLNQPAADVAQLFNENGVAIGPQFPVSSQSGDKVSDIVALSSGRFAITTTRGSNAYLKIYDSNGTLVYDEIELQTSLTATQGPRVAEGAFGEIVVAIEGKLLGLTAVGVQSFDAEGDEISSEQIIGAGFRNGYDEVDLVKLGTGMVLAWESNSGALLESISTLGTDTLLDFDPTNLQSGLLGFTGTQTEVQVLYDQISNEVDLLAEYLQTNTNSSIQTVHDILVTHQTLLAPYVDTSRRTSEEKRAGLVAANSLLDDVIRLLDHPIKVTDIPKSTSNRSVTSEEEPTLATLQSRVRIRGIVQKAIQKAHPGFTLSTKGRYVIDIYRKVGQLNVQRDLDFEA